MPRTSSCQGWGITETVTLIRESPHLVYLGLGSSLGDRWECLQAAVRRLAENHQLKLEAVSSVYESPHLGLKKEDANRYPMHFNCVLSLRTSQSPGELLHIVRAIEDLGGRERGQKWAPRTIDIDILLYGNVSFEGDGLSIPHPGLHKRSFVLLPLLELNTELCLPGGTEVKSFLEDPILAQQQIRRIVDRELLL